MDISVVGGVYKEICGWPAHSAVLGSAGRAALCLSQLDENIGVKLFSKISESDEIGLRKGFAFNSNCSLELEYTDSTVSFDYFHPLSEPKINNNQSNKSLEKFTPSVGIEAHCVLFGMIETTPMVNCKTLIYDPQNTYSPVLLSDAGCTAQTVIYIVNENELNILTKECPQEFVSVEDKAKWLKTTENASVVVVKCGRSGAFVLDGNSSGWVHPFKTDTVFPIGSGDSFVAGFAYYWLVKNDTAIVAAQKASVVTAYYVSHKTLCNHKDLDDYGQQLVELREAASEKTVYLAGPFFTLAELWMVNEAKYFIESFGMKVFSPYHDVGIGSAEQVVQKDIDAIHDCDVMYAIFDGNDPGTLFEIGYARSLNKPVVVLSQNPKSEDLKMYEGSGCCIVDDFASSIYLLSWISK